MDWQAAGQLRLSTRTRAGDMFVRMYELAEEVARDGIDFAAVARVEGRRVLISRLLAADGTVPDEAALGDGMSLRYRPGGQQQVNQLSLFGKMK